MYSAIALNRYGSLEIKRAYRKNMTIGIMMAAIILITGVVTYHCFVDQSINEPIVLPPGPIDTIRINEFQSISYVDPQPTKSSIDEKPVPTNGIPTPVPDDLADDNSTIPTDDELWKIVNSRIITKIEDLDTNAIVISNPDNILPPPDTFIPVDEMPRTIESVAPIFPEMARIAGVQGEVWVRAFIDKNGNVRDVIIFKPSGTNVGFEESAIAAAKLTTWTPAISNGQPVGVWISYKIEFRLR